jgi:hypothetical protein
MSAPAVAVALDGKRLVAAWKDVREGGPRVWWGAASEPKAIRDAPVSEEPRVDRDHPSLGLAGDGHAWVAWEDGSRGAQRVRARSDAKGARVVDVSGPDEGPAAFPAVACGAGLVVVAYETSLDGKTRSYVRVLEDAP